MKGMILPAVDLGLMAEHIEAHEGVINRIKIYETMVRNKKLQRLLSVHKRMLRNHVITMLALINPDRQTEVQLPEMELLTMVGTHELEKFEKEILLDAMSTAKLMGGDNFNSSLMMKNINVKNIHMQMSYQDVSVQMIYEQLLEAVEGDFLPMASIEEQRKTLKHFAHVNNL